MKLQFKTLSRQSFTIDAEPSEKVNKCSIYGWKIKIKIIIIIIIITKF